MLAHPLTNEGAGDKVNLEITFFRVSLRALGFYEVIAAGYGCMQDWLQTGLVMAMPPRRCNRHISIDLLICTPVSKYYYTRCQFGVCRDSVNADRIQNSEWRAHMSSRRTHELDAVHLPIPSMRVMRSDHEYDLRVVDDRERYLGYSSMPCPSCNLPRPFRPIWNRESSIRSGFTCEDAVTGET
jgi:hypothetical protein